MEKIQSENNRILYFDLLRIASLFFVILAHVSAYHWYDTDVTSFSWQVFNFYDSISRWSVLAFVMISGALFLSKDINIEHIYKKYVFHIITVYLFWSVIYTFVDILRDRIGFKTIISHIIKGHYHMWFLFMIVGLYIIIPFLKRITESKYILEYFLLVALLVSFVIPQCIDIITFFSAHTGDSINTIWKNVSFHFTLGYVSYFVLGYYIDVIELSEKTRRIIYYLGTVGFIATVIFSSLVSIHFKEAKAFFYQYYTLNILLESLGVFVFFKYEIGRINISTKAADIISKLSKYSFGAYLVHALFIELLGQMGFDTLSFNPAVSVFVISFIVFIASFVVSGVLNHIPKLNKYIV